ncbi:hypothetical protein MBLNU459_g2016t1 [Dothideomycetes sp. NU459]
MSVLITPIPSNLSYLFDSTHLSSLNGRVRGTRVSKSVGSKRSAFAVVDTSPDLESTGELTGQPLPPPSSKDPEDVVSLLSPRGDLTNALILFTSAYGSVTGAFSEIFTFPFLDSLKMPGSDPTSGSDSPSDTLDAKIIMTTRQLLLDGNANFHNFCDFEKQTCRNLIGYSTLLNTLLKQQTPSAFADSVEPVVSKYTDQLDARNEEKAKAFKQLINFTAAVKKNIASTTRQLQDFRDKIAATEAQLNNHNVGRTLLSLLGNLFSLSGSDDEIISKLAVLLGIATSALTGNFAALYKEKARLQELLTNLRRLQTQLETVNNNMTVLSSALGSTIEANDVLADVWTEVSDKLTTLQSMESSEEKLSPAQLSTVLKAWQTTKDQANIAVGALSTAIVASAAVASSASSFAASEGSIGIPQSALLDPRKFKILKKLATSPEITSHIKATAYSNVTALEGSTDNDEDQKKAEDAMNKAIDYLGTNAKCFSPPPDVQEALGRLAGDCSAIIKTFSNVLEIPYVDQLQILNPFKTKDTPDLPEQLDIRTIVLAYQKKYQDLQTDSITCVRTLLSYAAYQLVVLPRVTPFAPRSGQVGLDTYMEACQNVVSKYKEQANTLSDRYTTFGQEWALCQSNLQNAINKCSADATAARDALQKEKDKYEKQTIMGVLEIFGAVALFAIGAFTMPLGLLAIGAGGYLLYKGIKDLQGLSEINAAIDSFNKAITSADSTEKALTILKDPMQKVAQAVANVGKIWSDITQSLTNIEVFMITWVAPKVFIVTVGDVVKEWGNIKQSSENYIAVITGGSILT